MTSRFVLDSFAWVEYFRGTKAGQKVKALLENQRCFTPVIVIAELSDKYSREKHSFWNQDLDFMLAHSTVLPLRVSVAVLAGKLKQAVRKKYENRFGLADAVILASARSIKAQVVTGDHHFKPIQNVAFLG